MISYKHLEGVERKRHSSSWLGQIRGVVWLFSCISYSVLLSPKEKNDNPIDLHLLGIYVESNPHFPLDFLVSIIISPNAIKPEATIVLELKHVAHFLLQIRIPILLSQTHWSPSQSHILENVAEIEIELPNQVVGLQEISIIELDEEGVVLVGVLEVVEESIVEGSFPILTTEMSVSLLI